MIKIMHVSSSLAFGGLERLVRNFADQLDSTRYEFSACCLQKAGIFAEQIQAMGHSVHILGKENGFSPSLFWKLYRLFRTNKIDIVHTHNFAPLLYATIPARLAGVKVLVHTDHARTAFPDLPRRMAAERWLSRYLDAITAVSTQVKKDLVAYEKIDSDLIRVIVNGIELRVEPPTLSALELRNELQIPITSSVVGVCCRLAEQKGVAYLLEAAVKILKQHANTVFLIVGDGELKPDLERLTARLDLGTHVRFTGFRKDVPNILNLLDVYVLPSLFEGTPLGLLEAMLVQKPVVATLVGSNGDIVEDRISGRLVESKNSDQLADAIADLLINPEMAKKMGEQAREQVLTHFSLDRMIADYDALYRELLSAHHIET